MAVSRSDQGEDPRVADLFSGDPSREVDAIRSLASSFTGLASHPTWSTLKDYVARVRQKAALASVSEALEDPGMMAVRHAYTTGYIAGVKDVINSVENLIASAATIQRREQEREELELQRRRHPVVPVTGRGGL